MTIWDFAVAFADETYPRHPRLARSHEDLVRLHDEALRECRGIENKRWLFVYSPSSMSSLFECGSESLRAIFAQTKLMTVAGNGGMLFTVSVSGWATPKAKMTPKVLACV